MVAELGGVRAYRLHLAGERRGDVYHVVYVVAHDQQHLPDAVGSETRCGVGRIVERSRRAEVTGLHDGVTDGAVVRVKLRDPVAWGSAIRVMRHDGVGAFLSNQPGRGPRQSRSGP